MVNNSFVLQEGQTQKLALQNLLRRNVSGDPKFYYEMRSAEFNSLPSYRQKFKSLTGVNWNNDLARKLSKEVQRVRNKTQEQRIVRRGRNIKVTTLPDGSTLRVQGQRQTAYNPRYRRGRPSLRAALTSQRNDMRNKARKAPLRNLRKARDARLTKQKSKYTVAKGMHTAKISLKVKPKKKQYAPRSTRKEFDKVIRITPTMITSQTFPRDPVPRNKFQKHLFKQAKKWDKATKDNARWAALVKNAILDTGGFRRSKSPGTIKKYVSEYGEKVAKLSIGFGQMIPMAFGAGVTVGRGLVANRDFTISMIKNYFKKLPQKIMAVPLLYRTTYNPLTREGSQNLLAVATLITLTPKGNINFKGTIKKYKQLSRQIKKITKQTKRPVATAKKIFNLRKDERFRSAVTRVRKRLRDNGVPLTKTQVEELVATGKYDIPFTYYRKGQTTIRDFAGKKVTYDGTIVQGPGFKINIRTRSGRSAFKRTALRKSARKRYIQQTAKKKTKKVKTLQDRAARQLARKKRTKMTRSQRRKAGSLESLLLRNKIQQAARTEHYIKNIIKQARNTKGITTSNFLKRKLGFRNKRGQASMSITPIFDGAVKGLNAIARGAKLPKIPAASKRIIYYGLTTSGALTAAGLARAIKPNISTRQKVSIKSRALTASKPQLKQGQKPIQKQQQQQKRGSKQGQTPITTTSKKTTRTERKLVPAMLTTAAAAAAIPPLLITRMLKPTPSPPTKTGKTPPHKKGGGLGGLPLLLGQMILAYRRRGRAYTKYIPDLRSVFDRIIKTGKIPSGKISGIGPRPIIISRKGNKVTVKEVK